MRDMKNEAALLRTFARAMEADLAVTPMIVVGADQGERPWTSIADRVETLAEAVNAAWIPYDVARDQIEDLADWSGSTEEGDDSVLNVVILMMRDPESDALEGMLKAVHDNSVKDTLVAVVIREADLQTTCASISSALGVPTALVPTFRQDEASNGRHVQIVAEATMMGRTNGRYLISAVATEPYPHEIEIFVDPGDRDDETMFAIFEGFGPDAPFAATTTIVDGEIRCAIDDVTAL